MKLYITRHGQTDWNARNQALGSTDIPLNEAGRQQARQAAEDLKDLQFDAIYCSPLSRAHETAEIIAANQKAKPVDAWPLREQDFGIYEGTLRTDENYQREKYMYFKPFEGGESFLDVAARVYPFLESLKEKHGPDDKVLLVCHGGICRIIHNYFEGMDNDTFAKYFLENCQLESFDVPAEHKEKFYGQH